MTSILKPWVTELGLRHQGALVSMIRGCDSIPKEDPAKALIRNLRAVLLEPHCGDPAKCASFIEVVPPSVLLGRMQTFLGSFDHYPVHFLLHLLQAVEIIGYKHRKGHQWASFYRTLCKKMHVNPETEEQLDHRLHADEKTFAGAEALSTWPHELLGAPAARGGKSRVIEQLNSDSDKPEGVSRTTWEVEAAKDAKEQLAEIEATMKWMSNPNNFKNIDITDPAIVQRDLIQRINQTTRNPNQADPTRPMSEQLPEAFVKGFSDYKCFHVTITSNPYKDVVDQSLWESGWLAANRAKHNGYDDPRPRQEGFDAYHDGLAVTDNPYQAIAKGSQEWNIGWERGKSAVELEGYLAGETGPPWVENPYKAVRPRSQWYVGRNKRVGERVAAGDGDATPGYVNQDRHGFDKSGFYEGHKPTAQQLDREAMQQYRGVPRS